MNDSDVQITAQEALDFHSQGRPGKIEIVATKPMAIRREDIPKDIVDKEREIAKEQAAALGKPANILEKIAEGKLNSFFAENALIEQIFVKDNKSKIRDLLKQAGNATVTHLVRFKVGEEAS